MKRVSKTTAALIIGYIVVASLLMGLFSFGVIQISSPGNNPRQGSAIFLFNASNIQFSPTGTFLLENDFNVSVTSIVQGAFTSTHGALMYLVTLAGAEKNYSKYYTYSTGNVTSASIFVTIAPGTYHFIITNPVNGPTNITITQSIEVYPISGNYES